jgi:hypothetical protein
MITFRGLYGFGAMLVPSPAPIAAFRSVASSAVLPGALNEVALTLSFAARFSL